MELGLFDEVAEAVRGLVPRELGAVRCRPRRFGIKVWFGGASPGREHYEAQVIGPDDDSRARILALEVGFHAEHPDVNLNDAVIAKLLGCEKRWRRELGQEAVVGPFLGRPDQWRRVSETWPDPDLTDVELPFEVAARITDYVVALEPALRAPLPTRRGQGRRTGTGG
jgi:hypothetical protein